MLRIAVSGLRARLMALVLLAVVPVAGLILYTSWEQRRDQAQQVQDNTLRLTQVIANEHGYIIENAHQLLLVLARLPEVRSGDAAACNAVLAGLLEEYPRYVGLGVAGPDGDIFCVEPPTAQPVNIADREYAQRAIATRDFAVSEYLISRGVDRKPAIAFAYPILDGSGAILGLVVGGLDLAWLNDVAIAADLPEGAVLTVIDRNGVILAREPEGERWVGKALPEQPLVQTVLERGEGTAQVAGLDEVERFAAFAPLGGTDEPAAYVSVGISEADVYATANAQIVRNLVLLGAAAALALIAAWLAGDWFVVGRVRALVALTGRLRGGDLQARSGAPYAGELGGLAQAVDAMAGTLQTREAERRRAEEELARHAKDLARSNAELEQFAYVASHDLQEPLRMVSNYTQLLALRYRGKLDPEADEFIDYAVGGATRMQSLIRDLLEFSRVGRRGKEFLETDCEAVLERVLLNLRAAIDETGAAVTHGPLPSLPADSGQLVQVFQNLIGNAIKFRGAEPPRVHVSAQRRGGEYVFCVQDNGIGIDSEYFERIFVIFQRLNSREEYPGTGIGLALSKKVVERHGGRMWLESEPGKGTRFYFSIPAAKPALSFVAAPAVELVA